MMLPDFHLITTVVIHSLIRIRWMIIVMRDDG